MHTHFIAHTQPFTHTLTHTHTYTLVQSTQRLINHKAVTGVAGVQSFESFAPPNRTTRSQMSKEFSVCPRGHNARVLLFSSTVTGSVTLPSGARGFLRSPVRAGFVRKQSRTAWVATVASRPTVVSHLAFGSFHKRHWLHCTGWTDCRQKEVAFFLHKTAKKASGFCHPAFVRRKHLFTGCN